MKKLEITVALISVSLTLLFASLFGFAGSAVIGTFWGWFWLSLLVLVVGFSIVNSYLIRKDQMIREAVDLETLRELTKMSVNLECAYCQQRAIVPILLNQRNTFKCDSCNQINGISMQFVATALTSPIDSVKLPIESSTAVEFKVST